jgi:hypothetical protein
MIPLTADQRLSRNSRLPRITPESTRDIHSGVRKRPLCQPPSVLALASLLLVRSDVVNSDSTAAVWRQDAAIDAIHTLCYNALVVSALSVQHKEGRNV